VIDAETAVVRLLIAVVFGAIIGIERQWRHKNAGIKTSTLVAIGAAGFAVVSDTFGPENHNPGQIAAAVVSGIGFIGAGVIIHRGATVQGVTTAATLWADASMGVAIGLGQYWVGATLFGGIVLVQFVMRSLSKWIQDASRGKAATRVEVAVECEPSSVPQINAAWKESGLAPIRRSTTRGRDRWIWRAAVISEEPLDLTALEEKLVTLEGVLRVEARFLGYDDEPSSGL
jgi:uncharacterized membrane protein YhiD involved in acid resistance